MKKKSYVFLLASFFSAIGDFIIIFSLPNGLAKESGKISLAVFFWLIPALAIVLASFFGKALSKRLDSERTDYAKLLIALGSFEVLICFFLLFFRGLQETIFVCFVFLAFFAFIKEGISRLLYNVTVYRFFTNPSEYTKISGKKAALDIIGGLIGIIIASYLVNENFWKFSLIIDAITYFILGFTILIYGKNQSIKYNIRDALPNYELEKNTLKVVKNVESSLKYILTALPLIHAVNALYQNYQPLINYKLNIMSVSGSILLISILRMPSVIIGLNLERIHKAILLDAFIKIFPFLYIFLSLLFLLCPSIITMMLTVIMAGAFTGVYMPIVLNILNLLPANLTIKYNTFVIRWIGIFQGLACIASVFIYNNEVIDVSLICFLIIFFSIFSIFLIRLMPSLIFTTSQLQTNLE